MSELLNQNYITLAQNFLEIKGDPYGNENEEKIADDAIADIHHDFKLMRTHYFCNKRYENLYQYVGDISYSYGPTHVYVVDSIGLKREARHRSFSEEEKKACIHCIQNYNLIKKLERKS